MKFPFRLLAVTVIAVVDGRCIVTKGKVAHRILRDAGDCLVDGGVESGEIWITGNGRVRFSREIHPDLHQRLRNILTQI